MISLTRVTHFRADDLGKQSLICVALKLNIVLVSRPNTALSLLSHCLATYLLRHHGMTVSGTASRRRLSLRIDQESRA